MGDLGISDLDGIGRQALPDVADPVVAAHRNEGLGDGFVERCRSHLKLVRGIVQVVDNDGAGFQWHQGNLSYSLCVRLQSSAGVGIPILCNAIPFLCGIYVDRRGC